MLDKVNAILEKWGFYHVNRYLSKNRYWFSYVPHEKVLFIAVLTSFTIGAFVTTITATMDVIFMDDDIFTLNVSTVLFIIITNITMVLIEFWLLFHIGFQSIARYIYEFSKLQTIDANLKTSLVRAVLELDEPNQLRHELRAYKRNHKKHWCILLIYKSKAMLSNLLAKILLRKIVGRSGARIYIPLISIIITGVWDALVQLTVLKEARLRLYSRYYITVTVDKLTNKRHDALYIEILVRITVLRINSFGEHNINLDYFINEIERLFPKAVSMPHNLFDIKKIMPLYANLSKKDKESIKDLMLFLMAFKSTKLTKDERNLLMIFQTNVKDVSMYKKNLYALDF